jgi:1,2-diacylglycerol 3-beta-galactosyltransferase
MVRRERVWKQGFALSDGPRRSRVLSTAVWPAVRRAMKRLIREHPADVIVSVHPLFQTPLLRALGPRRPPYITVVTDLVSAHAMWFHPGVDGCLVPTEPARARALACGMPPAKVSVLGLPVAARFSQPAGDRLELRRKLGWRPDLPVVLLAGGGDGMGPLFPTARAIAGLGLPLQLAIVTGRNQQLRRQLGAVPWEVPAYVYGFVGNMPELMGAADLMVSKAGPSTITEAFNAGLPLVLSSALPGQEQGNVGYVVGEGAGLWAPGPEKVANAVKTWLAGEGREGLEHAAANARRLAFPHAAADIGREIGCLVGLE